MEISAHQESNQPQSGHMKTVWGFLLKNLHKCNDLLGKSMDSWWKIVSINMFVQANYLNVISQQSNLTS